MFFEKFFWKICVAPLDKSLRMWYNNHKLIIYSPTCFTFFSFFIFSIIIIPFSKVKVNSFRLNFFKKVFEKHLTWRIKMWYNKRGGIFFSFFWFCAAPSHKRMFAYAAPFIEHMFAPARLRGYELLGGGPGTEKNILARKYARAKNMPTKKDQLFTWSWCSPS